MAKNTNASSIIPNLEILEDRLQMSVTSATLGSDGWLRLVGNNYGSNVTVNPSGSTINVRDTTNGLNLNYSASAVRGVVFLGGAGADTFINNVFSLPIKAYGGDGNDYLEGYNGADYLHGGEGDDILYGYGGNDFIDGWGGNDLIKGGDGNDDLRGGWGYDRVYGQAGNDWMDGGAGDTFIDYLEGGSGRDGFAAVYQERDYIGDLRSADGDYVWYF